MKNLHHILFSLILLLVAVIIFIADDFRDVIFQNTQIDTVGHCIGFFILTWLLSSLGKLPTTALVFALITYAALSEIGQYYLGFRNGEFKDFIADVIGILLFVVLKWGWLIYGKKTTNG
ncbi:MAG: hypothetical protein CL811_01870 [Colwelliaceae bacterium]|nr:hypothetical protein [Colwelliaceae bacterium]